MEWTYNEEDLARLLCPAFNVKSIKWDTKKKQLILEIEIPTAEERMKALGEKLASAADPTKGGKAKPGAMYA